MADDVPAAWSFGRVNARVLATDRNGAGRDARARCWETGGVQARIEIAEGREARRKAEHVDFVDHGGVTFADLSDREAIVIGDALQVWTIINYWNFLDSRCCNAGCGDVV